VLEGQVIPLGGERVRVRLSSGSLILPAAQIAAVRDARTPEEIAQAALAQLSPEDADGVVELARWASVEKAFTLSRQLYREALRREADHPEARQALGYRRHEGEWLTEADYHMARGEVFFRGQWMPSTSRTEILKAEAAATEARAAAEREPRVPQGRQLAPEPRAAEERWATPPVAVIHPYTFSGFRYGGQQTLAPFRIGQIQLAYPGHYPFLRPLHLGHHRPRHPHPGHQPRHPLLYSNRGIQQIGIGVIGGPR
jgi:hypothetical protein